MGSYLKKQYSILSWCLGVGTILTMIFYIASAARISMLNSIRYQFNYNTRNSEIFLPRVLCFITTSPKNFLTNAKAINETWAPRCNRYFFVTEVPSNSSSLEFNISTQFPIAQIGNITPGYNHLTQKSVLAFLFAYKHYIYEFDWFIKTDDDTYIFVENLKKFLSNHAPSDPVTFGYNFKGVVEKGFHSGGASYVLSQEALKRFYEAQHDLKSNCSKDGGAEDVEIAKCLRTKGVYPGKSVDKENRELFHPLSFINHFQGKFPDWLLTLSENPLQSHYNCCSDQTISFHYVSADEQYLIDFLSYRMRSA